MTTRRQRIEDAIEHLIMALDEIDGDPDLELEPLEEQHDGEAELTWISNDVPLFYVIAESARRRAKSSG